MDTCREAVLIIFREWSVCWHHGVPAPDPGPGLVPRGTPPPRVCYQLKASHSNPNATTSHKSISLCTSLFFFSVIPHFLIILDSRFWSKFDCPLTVYFQSPITIIISSVGFLLVIGPQIHPLPVGESKCLLHLLHQGPPLPIHRSIISRLVFLRDSLACACFLPKVLNCSHCL